MKCINTAVIGAGHLGKQHVRICRSLPGIKLIAAVDTNSKTAAEIGKEYDVAYYTDYRKILDKVSAVSIITPTKSHYSIAADCLKHGIHTFIEKPITTTIEQAKKLIALAQRKHLILQVGHIERFNPALSSVKNYINRPRFIECHRLSPLSFRSLDIDVVRDLMIHDIDIILSLVKEKPLWISAIGVAVFSKRIDLANARISFPGGCVANLTASRVSDKSLRKMRIFSKDTYVSTDFLSRTARVYRKSDNAPSPKQLLKNIDLSTIKDYQSFMRKNFLEITEPAIRKTDQLKDELASFVTSIRTGSAPVVSGKDGLNALMVAEEIIDRINKEQSYVSRR